MFFFGQGGNHVQVFRRGGDGQPGTAAAVLGGVWKAPGWRAAEDAEEGEVQAGGFVVMESLADDVVIPDVEGAEAQGYFQAGDGGGPFEPGELGDPYFARGMRRDGRRGGEAGPGDLLVKEGGKEEELGVLEGESVAPFMDAAFAEDDRLGAGAEGVADDGPFFERCGHGDAGRGIYRSKQRKQRGWVLYGTYRPHRTYWTYDAGVNGARER